MAKEKLGSIIVKGEILDLDKLTLLDLRGIFDNLKEDFAKLEKQKQSAVSEKNMSKILESTKNNMTLESNIMKVESAIFMKKGNRILATKGSDFKECILESAENFGQKIETDEKGVILSKKESEIIHTYILALEKINRNYENKYKVLLDDKLELQNQKDVKTIEAEWYSKKLSEEKEKTEYKRTVELKGVAKSLIESESFNELTKVNKELKDLSKKLKAKEYQEELIIKRTDIAKINEVLLKVNEELKMCHEERRKALELLLGRKENLLNDGKNKSLVLAKKKSFLKSIIDKILNKLYAKERYNENVLKVLENRGRDLTYKALPSLREKIKKETLNIHIEARIALGIDEKNTKEEFEKNFDKPKESYTSIITKKDSEKMWDINKLEIKVIEKKQKARNNIRKQKTIKEIA